MDDHSLSHSQIQYVDYHHLPSPNINSLTCQFIHAALTSKSWKEQFEALTNLRQANKHYSAIFLHELLPRLYEPIINQIDNLRSNNSKEALTLLSELIIHQKIEGLSEAIMSKMIEGLFSKATCEKAFLRNEALKGINALCYQQNWYIINALISHVDSTNANICQLAIKTLHTYLDVNKIVDVDPHLLKALSKSLKGKRSVLEKTSKEILKGLKARKGQKELEGAINESSELTEEESNTLRVEINKQEKPKEQCNFKEFLQKKKKGDI